MTHLCSKFQFKMSICNGDNERKLNIIGIFLSPRDITPPKIIWLDPNSNLRIYVIHLCIKFQFKMSICNGDNEWKLKIIGIFLSPRGITPPKIIWLDPNSNLRIYVIHLCIKFQFKMSICNGDNERKLNIIGIFLSPRGITPPKIIWLDPNSNLRIYVIHLCIKFQFKMSICNGDNEWKLKTIGIFLSPRGITLPKIIGRPQYRTQPLYF